MSISEDGPRRYSSPARQQQAAATRRRIADAARQLYIAKGYAGTTIQEIARAAGVAPQTVYAVFGSKRGILTEIVDRATFGPGYEQVVELAQEAQEPAARLRLVARISRTVVDSLRAELDLLGSAGVVAPELAELVRERESRRLQRQAGMAEYLADAGALRPGLDATVARDILWALTGQELYRLLVLERGWDSDRYERWLADLLISALLAPERSDS
jgi:AcrR family transcriptional regulator